MLDVHPPHEKMHGFGDFLLHLLTITIGLLIALSLEGLVEWRHHRHLVHEAEAGLSDEIATNAKVVVSLQQQISKQQKQLDADLAVLSQMRTSPDNKNHSELSFAFGMQSFNDVAWRTAQTTGAFTYMPYNDANNYANIYDVQTEVFNEEHDVVDAVMRAASLPSTQTADWKPTPAEIDELTDRIGMLRMQLMLLNSLVGSLDHTYQKYESDHR